MHEYSYALEDEIYEFGEKLSRMSGKRMSDLDSRKLTFGDTRQIELLKELRALSVAGDRVELLLKDLYF